MFVLWLASRSAPVERLANCKILQFSAERLANCKILQFSEREVDMLAITRQAALRQARKVAQARRADDRGDEARQVMLSQREDFFLRVKARGYDLGQDNDPDGLLPTRYSK
jgi:hypothetical protein